MASIQPFRALRPRREISEKLASRPYDVLSSEEAATEAAGNPYSFLHITKSEIDLPAGTDSHSAEVYAKAAENLQEFIKKGYLTREGTPCYYIYELTMHRRSQTGLVSVSSIDDYEKDIIKKHEYTRPEKEQDRINHISTTGAQTGNVFLAYRDVNKLNALIDECKSAHDPLYNFTADDEVHHMIWKVDDAQVIDQITKLFEEKVPCTYIADGHHRAASAAKVRNAAGAKETSGYFLTTLFPASQLHIMDYNRVIKDLNGMEEAVFLRALYDDFEVERMESSFSPTHLHEFGMYLDKTWFKLTSKEGTFRNDPIGILDVTILQENILSKLLAIHDQRTDKRIDFVGGIRGLGELEKRVDSGEMKLAFSLHPVSIQQLFDISDSGNVMPPKSTWFEPKLRDGLLTHLLAD